MKILLTHSYFLRFDPKQWKIAQPYAPLATLYAAALLRTQGHEVRLFDPMFSRSAAEIKPCLDHFKPERLLIWDDGFNYLTKMCLTNMREAAFEMIAMAKASGCKVYVSSSDSTDHAANYLAHGADAIITGEGEGTILELLKENNANDECLPSIKGIAYLENGKLIQNQKREVMQELDRLPPPAWDLADIPSYKKMWMHHHGYFSMNLATTRGCPFKCNWCAKPIYGNRYNSHSPAYIIKEIKKLNEQYGAQHIWFCDDIFGLRPGWVKQFAELVKKEKLDFRFKIQSRVDLLLEDETVADLAKAGCETVWLGAESGSQKILDAMDKGTKVEQIYAATKKLKEHKIKPAFFIQFGYPGETKEDISKTLGMLSDLLPDDIGISISYPLPGTAFYEQVKHELTEKANWKDSDELALLFRNTYSPEFYKQLHRYVHRHYRKKQSLRTLADLLRDPASASFSRIRRSFSFLVHTPAAFFEKQKLDKLN